VVSTHLKNISQIGSFPQTKKYQIFETTNLYLLLQPESKLGVTQLWQHQIDPQRERVAQDSPRSNPMT